MLDKIQKYVSTDYNRGIWSRIKYFAAFFVLYWTVLTMVVKFVPYGWMQLVVYIIWTFASAWVFAWLVVK